MPPNDYRDHSNDMTLQDWGSLVFPTGGQGYTKLLRGFGQGAGIISDPNSPLNQAQRAADQGRYGDVEQILPSADPRTNEERDQYNTLNRIAASNTANQRREAEGKVKSQYEDLLDSSQKRWQQQFQLQSGHEKEIEQGRNQTQMNIAGINSQTQLGVAGINSRTQLGLGQMNLEGVKDTNRTNYGIADLTSSRSLQGQIYGYNIQKDIALAGNASAERIADLQSATQRYGTDKQYDLGMNQIRFGQEELYTKDRTQRRGQDLDYSLGRQQIAANDRRGLENLLANASTRSSFRR